MPPQSDTIVREIRENVAGIEARIEAACHRAGRLRGEVLLVGVSKTFPAAAVDAAVAAGITDVGENRVQEARDKKPLVTASAVWHLIGHLQSNKAKDAVELFDVIESVDSVSLATKVSRAAIAAGRTQRILLQVNIGRESQKSGIEPGELTVTAKSILAMEGLEVAGLMGIPPAGDLEVARNCFRELRMLRDALGLSELSMGMSEDFEVAIEEGSTIVRIGRAIFGTRGVAQ